MALRPEDALRCELRDVGTQKQGRFRKRINFYLFDCNSCPNQMWVPRFDMKKVSGRCRNCAASDSNKVKGRKFRKRPFEALFNKFAYDRSRFGQDSTLTYEEFAELAKTSECHYCGRPVTFAEYSLGRNGCRYNLDRMDNTRGYSKDNVVVCCWKCNETKSDRFTYEQFVKIGAVIRGF